MEELSATIRLVSPDKLPSDVVEALRSAPDGQAEAQGSCFLHCGSLVLCCSDVSAGKSLFDALYHAGVSSAPSSILSLEEAWRNLIVRNDSSALSLLCQEFGVREQRTRCVVLFQGQGGYRSGSLTALLEEQVPREAGEEIISLSEREVIFLKDTADLSREDCVEYVRAVIEMTESETGLSLTAGIGGSRNNAADLHFSLKEAQEAIRIGQQYRMDPPVFHFENQTLQRLIDDLPPERRDAWRKWFWTDRTTRMMTPEMKETVQAFFRNDLNLSTTARQLFLHRNTLTYRLDRICKETNLDLRSFRDAVIFQLMMDIPAESRKNSAPDERKVSI